MSAEGLKYENVIEPDDLYINCDSKGRCKYSRLPCVKCSFAQCAEDFTHGDIFISSQRRKEMVNLYRFGATDFYISKYFNMNIKAVCSALKQELRK